MQFYKFPGYRKANAAALVNHICGYIILEETFKYFLCFFWGDANACITHFYFKYCFIFFPVYIQ